MCFVSFCCLFCFVCCLPFVGEQIASGLNRQLIVSVKKPRRSTPPRFPTDCSIFAGCDKKDWNALVQGDAELFKLKSADSSPGGYARRVSKILS
jgi:hypothetical protein